MWYETWWFILLLMFITMAWTFTGMFIGDEWCVREHWFEYKGKILRRTLFNSLHRCLWVGIWNNKKLNTVGKVVAEIIVTTICLPFIIFLYVASALYYTIKYIVIKLFFKESK